MLNKSPQTIVIKVGSSSLTNPQGKLDLKNLKRLVAEIACLVKAGKKVLLVTSGAIVCGAEKLGLGRPKTIPEKQAAAAVGQSRLMRQYEKAFEAFGLTVAQVLLTKDVIANQERRQHAQDTFKTLLSENVVPIINENDTVAIEEIKFGDNDNLAALTAVLVGADLLILLTDVDGLYMKNDKGVPALVPEITKISRQIKNAAGRPATQLGTGGMITKIEAAKICQKAGLLMSIINGRKAGRLKKMVDRQEGGTIFFPRRGK